MRFTDCSGRRVACEIRRTQPARLPLQLFTDDRDRDFSPMWRSPVLKEKDALPRSELHFSIDHRYGLARARQCHPDMRWHIIAALGTVREVSGIFRHQPIEKLFQVAARGRIGVFHDENAATGVLNKYGHCPVSHFGSVDLRLQIVGDFVEALALRANFKSIMMNVHKFSDREYHVVK